VSELSILHLRRSRLLQHLPYLILLALGACALTAMSWLQHQAFGTGYDLGIYDQVVWNIAHGRYFMTTLVYETNGYYDHFEPILTAVAPLYWIWPDVRVLLTLQSVALALGSLPIYLFARRRLAAFTRFPTLVALLLAAAYLAFPPLHSANLNDFHEVALLPPLLGFALYGLFTGQRRVMFISLALCLMVKEDLGVTALTIGAFIAAWPPSGFRRRDGLWLCLVTIVWVSLILWVLYPALTRGMPYPFVQRRYSWLGGTPFEAAKGLVTHPELALAHILQPPKLVFLVRLFGPLLFLPLLGWPVIALCFPVLGYLMLSEYQPQWSVQSYYNPPLLAFLFFGLIEAVTLLIRKAARWHVSPQVTLSLLVAAVLAGVGYGYYQFAPGPGGKDFSPAAFSIGPRQLAAQQILDRIGPASSVSTIWALVPHLSHREKDYTLLARPKTPPDYLIEETIPDQVSSPLYPFAAPDIYPPVYFEYQPVFEAAPFQLLRYSRTVPLVSLPEPDPPVSALSLAGFAWLDGVDPVSPGTIKPGGSLRLMLGWHRRLTLDRRYVLFVHVLESRYRTTPEKSRLVTQAGHEAGNGRFPTPMWQTWTDPSIILDTQVLEFAPDTPPGTYDVWAGAYDRETMQRLDLTRAGESLTYITSVTVVGGVP
jgi:uncharacterized membrane protein